jgi:phosphopantetheine--protein transferase-like protein
MIGIDLVSIPEFRRQLEIGGANLVKRAFGEAAVQHRDVDQLAGMWAAKEAVYKAAEAPSQSLTNVMITLDASGSPHASFEGQRFAVSLSRTAEYVVALAMRLEK